MASENTKIVTEFLEELGTGSLEKALDFLTEDSKWAIVQTVRYTEMTKPELRARLGGMRAAFKDGTLPVKAINIIEQGDQVAAEMVSHSVTVLDKLYENRYCTIFKLRDGKIADVREYNDSLHVVDVLLPAVQHAMAQAKAH